MRQLEITPLLISQVVHIAHDAGSAIMSVYQAMARSEGVQTSHKSDGSPLTEADLQAHQIIATGLRVLTPETPLVSEEDASSLLHRTAAGEFWLIDPLDGTKEFLAQNDEFTVNIALIRDGKPVFGVVFAPALDLTFWGAQGQDAWRESAGHAEKISVSTLPAVLRIVASKSHMNEETVTFIEALGQHELIQAGSSLKFCRIAEGSADVYPRLGPTCEWDTAAAQAILEAAGGYVYTLDDAPLQYGKVAVLNPYFIASCVLPSLLTGRA